MIKINKNAVQKALLSFNIRPDSVTLNDSPKKKVWEVVRGSEKYALKCVSTDKVAYNVTEVSRHLQQNGLSVLEVLPTVDGKWFSTQNDFHFILTRWVSGTIPRYDNPSMLENITTKLSRFHQSSRGFNGKSAKIEDLFQLYPSHYEKKKNQLEKSRSRIHSSKDPFTRLFILHYPWLQSRIKWVLDHFPHAAFKSLIAQSRKDPFLQHGDYSRINVLADSSGQLIVIDLDTVAYALPVWDISRLITWVNHDLQQWSGDRLQEMLKRYQQIRPMSQIEQDLLQVDQIFPHLATNLAVSYYKGSKSPTLLDEFERTLVIDREKIKDLGLGPLT
ncbi:MULTISPECIES: phosphotransferase [unclassified Paenibacillus]|uniref:phosphotransferase n=1 Tax=unclassified Paenibacillus TaxID=185978 RepID=UPI001AEA9612|nr:spore coat protein I [Paenibacillus sp. PvP091]MBP1169222.1 spore coat protein I [Paenibacillus sp. PvR098]MBP2440250.1 spore coat protein I [Paenibacillus sp. PvP052]